MALSLAQKTTYHLKTRARCADAIFVSCCYLRTACLDYSGELPDYGTPGEQWLICIPGFLKNLKHRYVCYVNLDYFKSVFGLTF